MAPDVLQTEPLLHPGEDLREQLQSLLGAAGDAESEVMRDLETCGDLRQELAPTSPPVEWPLPHQHLVEDDARGPDVDLGGEEDHEVRSIIMDWTGLTSLLK